MWYWKPGLKVHVTLHHQLEPRMGWWHSGMWDMQLLEETYRDEGAAAELHDWLDQTPLALFPLEHMPVKEKTIT